MRSRISFSCLYVELADVGTLLECKIQEKLLFATIIHAVEKCVTSAYFVNSKREHTAKLFTGKAIPHSILLLRTFFFCWLEDLKLKGILILK